MARRWCVYLAFSGVLQKEISSGIHDSRLLPEKVWAYPPSPQCHTTSGHHPGRKRLPRGLQLKRKRIIFFFKKKNATFSQFVLSHFYSSGLASPRHLQPQAPVRNLASAAGVVQPLGRRVVAFMLRNSTHSGSAEGDQTFGNPRSVGHFTKLYEKPHFRKFHPQKPASPYPILKTLGA